MNNRFGKPEMMMQFPDGSVMTVTQAEAYSDAVIQRVGLIGKDLEAIADQERYMTDTLLPAIFDVLVDAGEIELVEGRKFQKGGPELAKLMVIATGVGSILGFNKAANDKFGEGKWNL